MSERGFTRGRRGGLAKERGWRSAGWVAVLVVAGLAGCAATGERLTADSPVTLKEKVVAERANARWQALIKRDYEAAYQYLSPASRETLSLLAFRTRFEAAEYKAVTVEKVRCEAQTCTVSIRLTYDLPPAKARGVVTPLDESWIIDGGQAWFVLRG